MIIELLISTPFPILQPFSTTLLVSLIPASISHPFPINEPLKSDISCSSICWVYLFGIKISFCFGPLIKLSKLTLSYIPIFDIQRMYSFWPATLAYIFIGFLHYYSIWDKSVVLFWFRITVSRKSDFKWHSSALWRFFIIFTIYLLEMYLCEDRRYIILCLQLVGMLRGLLFGILKLEEKIHNISNSILT